MPFLGITWDSGIVFDSSMICIGCSLPGEDTASVGLSDPDIAMDEIVLPIKVINAIIAGTKNLNLILSCLSLKIDILRSNYRPVIGRCYHSFVLPDITSKSYNSPVR